MKLLAQDQRVSKWQSGTNGPKKPTKHMVLMSANCQGGLKHGLALIIKPPDRRPQLLSEPTNVSCLLFYRGSEPWVLSLLHRCKEKK